MTMTEHEHKHEHDRREGDPLTAALRALREADDESRGASMEVEARLLAEVRAIAWARRRRRYVATTMASAAAVLVAGAIAFAVWRAVMTPSTPAGTRAATTTTAGTTPGGATVTGEIATAFIPLAYSSVPASEQYLVRMEVPRAALASFGLGAIESTARSSSKDTVLADVLVGQDGLARAVRFVRPSGGRGLTQSQPQTRTP